MCTCRYSCQTPNKSWTRFSETGQIFEKCMKFMQWKHMKIFQMEKQALSYAHKCTALNCAVIWKTCKLKSSGKFCTTISFKLCFLGTCAAHYQEDRKAIYTLSGELFGNILPDAVYLQVRFASCGPAGKKARYGQRHKLLDTSGRLFGSQPVWRWGYFRHSIEEECA